MSAVSHGHWMEDLHERLRKAGVEKDDLEGVAIIFQYAKVFIAMENCLPGGKLDDVAVNRVNLKPAPRSPHKTMLVVAGVRKRQPVVTFHTGNPGVDIFNGFLQRHHSDALKWLPDTPAHAIDPGTEVESLPTLPGR